MVASQHCHGDANRDRHARAGNLDRKMNTQKGKWRKWYCVIMMTKDANEQLQVKQVTKWDTRKDKLAARIRILAKANPEAQFSIQENKFHEKSPEVWNADTLAAARNLLRIHRTAVAEKRIALLRDDTDYRSAVFKALEMVEGDGWEDIHQDLLLAKVEVAGFGIVDADSKFGIYKHVPNGAVVEKTTAQHSGEYRPEDFPEDE